MIARPICGPLVRYVQLLSLPLASQQYISPNDYLSKRQNPQQYPSVMPILSRLFSLTNPASSAVYPDISPRYIPSAAVAVYPDISPQQIPLSIASRPLEPIRGTEHPAAPTVQHVGVNHRRTDVFVTEEFLDCANVIAIFKQVSRERVAKSMTTGVLG